MRWVQAGFLAAVMCVAVGCTSTEEGTVNVIEYYGHIESVQAPADGPFTTLTPGRSSHMVNLRSFTNTVGTRVTSKDNAALQVPVSVTAHTMVEMVPDYVRKFGFDEKERHARRDEILAGLIQTETRNGFSEYPAYEIYGSQEEIQKRITESLRPILKEQLFLALESVQIGNPDFLDDRIEQAAAAVVANEKAKQGAQAALEAARVTAEQRQVEAQSFGASPALLQIKLLELQLAIEQARAEGIKGHEGPLTIIYDSGGRTGVQVQAQNGPWTKPAPPPPPPAKK